MPATLSDNNAPEPTRVAIPNGSPETDRKLEQKSRSELKELSEYAQNPPHGDKPQSSATNGEKKEEEEKTQAEVPIKKWGSYMNQINIQGMFAGIRPTVTTDPNRLEAQAKEWMSKRSFNYVAGGAGERATMDANRLAFRAWKIIPRMLRQTTTRDLRTTILGHTYASPVIMAPVGVQGIFHEDAEVGTAQIARELGLPFTLSTAATTSIEAAAAANGDGDRWFQLYWPHDDDLTVSLLQRAKACNYKVLVVTLDTWTLSWRPWDLDAAYVPFFTGVGDQVGFSDPVFQRKFSEKHDGKKVGDPGTNLAAAQDWIMKVFSGQAHTWDQIKLLKDNWDGPILLKGIQHPEDARLAVEAGVQGVIVSNHGGRQMDGAVGSLDMLPEIVAEVGDEIEVLFDSGIRTGTDIIKALCLGAKGVLIGRPWVYGLGINGKEGAKAVLAGILADLDQSMGLGGMASIKDCNRSMIKRCVYPGDSASCS